MPSFGWLDHNMIPNDPALTFAVTLKRWFASNDWPQKITDDWARDVGNSTGPWASQVCNAMKAKGYNPKAEFFLALGTFNNGGRPRAASHHRHQAQGRLTDAWRYALIRPALRRR